jgi:hypothetical protein
MLSLPLAFSSAMGVFAPVLSRPVWQLAKVLITGAVLAPEKCIVTAMLQIRGRHTVSDLHPSHRVLKRAVWAPLTATRLLLRGLVAVCVPSGGIVFGLDDSMERRRGEQRTARGISRDSVQSSHTPCVKVSSLRWLAYLVLPPLAWADRVWALPLQTVLCPSERCYEQRGRRLEPLTARSWQLIRLVPRGLPGRESACVVDSSVAVLERLDQVQTLPRTRGLTRPRLEVALYDPPPHVHRAPQGGPGSKASAGQRGKQGWPMKGPNGPQGVWHRGRAKGHVRWRAPWTPRCGITRGNHRSPSAWS